VNLTDAVDEVVTHLSDDQLSSLVGVCADRRQAPPGLPRMAAGASPSARAAISQLLAAWAASPALTGPGIALSLEVGRRGRRREADLRPSAVWTGPGAALTERLTSGVLHELIAGARRRIVIVSFAAHTLPGVAVDLEAAITRGCAVDAVFETADDRDRRSRSRQSTGSAGGIGPRLGALTVPCCTPSCSRSTTVGRSSARRTSPAER
jgi:hypothetical protein